MAVAIRAAYPAGTTTATPIIAALSVTTASVAASAGDAVLVHAVLNSGVDTGFTLSATFNGVAADDASTAIHSNGQNAGFEQFFYWRNPGAVTASAVTTAAGGSGNPDWEQKVYVISGTANGAPVFTTFAPSGTGVTTAATITTSGSVASGDLAIAGFCAGSAFSSVNQTQQCIAQSVSTGNAANAIAGNSAAGAGAALTFTATISGADWYAATVAVMSATAGGTNATVVLQPAQQNVTIA